MNRSNATKQTALGVPAAVVVVLVSLALDARVDGLDGRAPILIILGLLGVLAAMVPNLRELVHQPQAPSVPTGGAGSVVGEPLVASTAQAAARTTAGPNAAAPTTKPAPGTRATIRPRRAEPDVQAERAAPVSQIAAEGFSIPKIGESDDKCEDAFAGHVEAGLFAVADGASSSFDARAWAQLLVNSFVKAPPPALSTAGASAWFQHQARTWAERNAGSRSERTAADADWWNEAGSERGAFATLLGVEIFTSNGEAWWQAVAVGDSCLLHMRGSDLLSSFPIDPGSSFGSHPNLLGTADHPVDAFSRMRWASGALQTTDTLLLLTDAVSEWALADRQNRQHLVTLPMPELKALVTKARADQAMVNDDLTVLRIRLS